MVVEMTSTVLKKKFIEFAKKVKASKSKTYVTFS